ncbi:uncharacterized protein DUF4537 [Roseimicrobium gellanilyticum]|uniref:Uncharacterized protein DUF4537 n=1 Tax=Roseimicrobium gellanilyticum TaxID=748857 RepID=A0A366HVZ6_9BACT|nr:DUF4537 domain-containing protein [Roseimicrobium gellanilyticum]RBP48090.1 uncharacterized protein DUF4537 [Roseimicrobium gellanilyticum]
MKTIRVLGATLMAVSVTFASQLLAGPGSQIGVGNRVAAMWSNGGYFLGTVTEIEGERFNILFEDGDRLAVDSSRVVALREDTAFAVGERVMAAWKGISMYPGVVTKVHAKSCMVKWDDGDAPLLVAKDKIFHADKAVVATTAVTMIPTVSDQTFKVGDHVMAVWKNGHKFPGVISQVEGNHFLIRWDDGDTPLWVAKEGISSLEGARVTTATTFNVGEHVAAQWRDSRYYPGVVTEVRGSQCLIKWDDGDEPLFVLQEHIRALPNTPSASLNVGDHVLASWKDGHKYPGVIAEVRGDSCLIRWDDGDEPLFVAKDKILPFPQQQVRLLPGATPGR